MKQKKLVERDLSGFQNLTGLSSKSSAKVWNFGRASIGLRPRFSLILFIFFATLTNVQYKLIKYNKKNS